MSLRALATRLMFVGAALTASVSQLHAQFSVTITVDEHGNGTLTNTAGFFGALPFMMAADPGPGGLGSALTYDMLNPPQLVAGDVLITHGPGGTLSDVIRFNTSSFTGGPGSLVFYSTLGGGALGDTGFPGANYANVLSIVEVLGGTLYTPTAGQPGFVAGAGGPVNYVFISDPDVTATPEPATFALLGTGLLLVGAAAARRRRNTTV